MSCGALVSALQTKVTREVAPVLPKAGDTSTELQFLNRHDGFELVGHLSPMPLGETRHCVGCVPAVVSA